MDRLPLEVIHRIVSSLNVWEHDLRVLLLVNKGWNTVVEKMMWKRVGASKANEFYGSWKLGTAQFYQLRTSARKRSHVKELDVYQINDDIDLCMVMDLLDLCGATLTHISLGWEGDRLPPYIRHRFRNVGLSLPNLSSLRFYPEDNDYCPLLSMVVEILRIAPNVEDLHVHGPCIGPKQVRHLGEEDTPITADDWPIMNSLSDVGLVFTPFYAVNMCDLLGNCPNLRRLEIFSNAMKWLSLDPKVVSQIWASPALCHVTWWVNDEDRIKELSELLKVEGCFPTLEYLNLVKMGPDEDLHALLRAILSSDMDRLLEIDVDLWTYWEKFWCSQYGLKRSFARNLAPHLGAHPSTREISICGDQIILRKYTGPLRQVLEHYRYQAAAISKTAWSQAPGLRETYIPEEPRIWHEYALYNGIEIPIEVLKDVYSNLGRPMDWTEGMRGLELPQECWATLQTPDQLGD